MTKKQQREILAIIAKDCTLARHYFEDGKTCVIGGLAQAAGVRKMALVNAGSGRINSDVWEPEMRPIWQAIWRKFGITLEQQVRLQDVNDEAEPDTLKTRRRKLAAIVKSWPVKEGK